MARGLDCVGDSDQAARFGSGCQPTVLQDSVAAGRRAGIVETPKLAGVGCWRERRSVADPIWRAAVDDRRRARNFK